MMLLQPWRSRISSSSSLKEYRCDSYYHHTHDDDDDDDDDGLYKVYDFA